MAKRSLFNQGYGGIADSPHAGQAGSVYRSVGIDHKSKPGVMRAHQALQKGSGSIVDQLCETSLALSDGSTLWFGETKVWREEDGVFEQKYELQGEMGDIVNVSGGTATESKKLGRASQVVRFSDDGYYMFTLDRRGSLDQFTLTKAFDVTTAVLRLTKSITARSFAIGRDGTRLFILNKDSIDVYDMATFDIGSALKKTSHDISTQVDSSVDIEVSVDGNNVYVLDRDGTVHQYAYSTPWGGEYATFWVMAVAGGGGGGAVGPTTTTNNWRRSGGGGAGGFMEDTNFAISANTAYSISVGLGGLGGAPGDNDGQKGGDTTGCGITLKGGGFGSDANTSGSLPTLAGGPGGNGGGGGRYNDYGGGPGGVREDCSPRLFGGVDGSSGPGSGGGFNISSSITGTLLTYAVGGASKSGNTTSTDAVDGTGDGGSGAATQYPGGNQSYPGGKGGSGKFVLRFKTSGVATFTQTGGTVSTVGDDTVIVWLTTGTFEFTYSNTLSFVASKLIDGVPNALSLDGDKMLFGFDDTIKQFAITDNDITSITYNDIVLKADSALSKSNNISSVVLTEDYLFVGWETGNSTTDYNVTRYKFIEPGTCFCTAIEHSVSIAIDAKSSVIADMASKNVGATTQTSIDNFTGSKTLTLENNATLAVSTVDSFDRGIKTFVYKQDDPSFNGRGYLQSISGVAAMVYFNDSLAYNLPASGRKIVLIDQVVISNDSAFGNVGQYSLEPSQTVIFKKDTDIDTVAFSLREGLGLNGGYTLRAKVKDDDGTVLREVTYAINTSALSSVSETLIPFEFTKLTLRAGIVYTVSISIDNISALNLDLKSRRYLVVGIQSYSRGFAYDTANTNNELRIRLYDSTIVDSEADTIPESRIYFATKTGLFYIKTTDAIGDWAGKVTPVGEFKNKHDEHQMIVTNNIVYISDAHDMAIIAENGVFAQTSMLNLPKRENITAMGPYDVDVIVGTSLGRVLRYPLLADSWIAEDIVPDGRVNAIIKDDNYTYIAAGSKGRIYFYNGASLEQSVTLPGDWGSTNEAIVKKGAVGFINNSPVFGVSNVSGNPVLQGIYALGSFGKSYRKVLTLDYPLSHGQFDNTEIGSVVEANNRLLVSWHRGHEYGVDILDNALKYSGAYFETTTIMANEELGYLKSVVSVDIPYVKTLTNADLTVSYREQSSDAYKSIEMKRDKKRSVFAGQKTLSEIGNVHLKVELAVSENESSEIADLLYDVTADNKD